MEYIALDVHRKYSLASVEDGNEARGSELAARRCEQLAASTADR